MAAAVVPKGFVLDPPTTKTTLPRGFVLDSEAKQVPDALDNVSFQLDEMIKNIPGSALQLGKDMIAPILSPVETAKSLQSVGQGLVEKILPDTIDGVDFGQTENEESIDKIGEFLNSRYGSADNFLSTIEKDPAGVAFDISGILTGGGTLLPKAGKLAAIGKAIDPVNIVINSTKQIGRLVPENLPRSLLETAIKIRPSVPTKERIAMVDTALREGILPTVDGLEKIATRLITLDSKLDNIIDTATSRGVLINKKVLFGQLKQLRKELGGAKLEASNDLRVISDVASEFNRQLTKIKKDNLTPREVQSLKTDAYKRVNFDMSQGQGNFAKNETRKTIARSAKESLEAIDPNVKGINEDMGSLIQLHGEMERVVSRLDNRNLISLDTATKIVAGASVNQGIGTSIGVAASALGAPRIKATIAMTLHNLRKNAQNASFIQNKLNPVLARQLLVQSGRIDEALRKELEQTRQD